MTRPVLLSYSSYKFTFVREIMETIKVLVADDHPAFREGLCHFLENEKGLEVVAKATDGEEAIRLSKELLPDVAIIDVAMPKVNGIEAARQIKAACPATAILMLSAYGYESYLLTSLRLGVAGYVLKDAPVSELISTVRLVHIGEAVFDLKAISKVLDHLGTDGAGARRGLGEIHPRELQVLKSAAKGISNKAIAEELHISERTVQTHMVSIFRKLKVGSRTEAVLHALREGWLNLDDLP